MNNFESFHRIIRKIKINFILITLKLDFQINFLFKKNKDSTFPKYVNIFV